MAQTSLIDIKSGKVIEQVKANLVSVKAPSIVKISLSPQDMKSYYKSGNNLVIELKSGKQIVLENFFVAAPDGARNELVLEDQGHYWHASYGENEASLSLKEISGMDELLISEDGDNAYMWLVGALGLGGVVALAESGGSGGEGSSDSQPGASTLDSEEGAEVQSPTTASNESISAPQAVAGEDSDPSTVLPLPVIEPQLGTVDPTTGALPVTGRPGATVQLHDKDGNPVGTPVVLDGQGQGTLILPPSLSGESLSAVQTSGNAISPASNAITTPVLPPVVGVVDPQTGVLPVEGKPGATVQLKDASGNAIGAPVTLDSEGKGEVQVPPTLSGQTVTLTQTVDGQESQPSGGTAVSLQKPDLVVDPDKGEIAVTGKPGSTVQLQDKDGNPVGEPVVLDEQGQGTVVLPPEVSGEQVEVVVKDGDQQSPVATVNVPLLAPQLGAVDPVTGELPVIGKPGASVQLQDQNGNSVGAPVILDAQGHGAAKVPSSLSGEPLSAVQISGNATSPASNAITTPVLPPVVGVVDPQTGVLPVEGKPGATVQLKDAAGNAVGTSVTLGSDGKGEVQVPPILSGQTVAVTQKIGEQESQPSGG
ncbi:BapA prefix-like domain-containing protein, partial [Pseudomonas chlororaphis]|uniref:BapA/Bap/LapF family prefix-like domain-containing protein n=1 Tax=Pseudomonas chlororaphis TaxID=587753 RepID=UPI001E560220